MSADQPDLGNASLRLHPWAILGYINLGIKKKYLCYDVDNGHLCFLC